MQTTRTSRIAGVLVTALLALQTGISAAAEWKTGDKVVSTSSAPVKVRTRTLTTVPKGTELVVEAVKGDWIAVVVERDGKKISGWIRSRQLARVSNAIVERPNTSARKKPGTQESPTYFPLMPPTTTGNEEGANDGPTPGLFKKLSLISYKFGSDRRDRTYKIFGEDMFSLFSVFPKGDGLEITARIPDSHGRLKYRGMLLQMSTLGLGGNVVSNTGSNGYVWTARIERIGGFDLSTEGKITELPSFDFDSFSKTKEVIQFANGYAVNLFGAIVENKRIIQAGSKKTYLDSSGKKLYGRVISRIEKNGKPTFEETILK